MSDKNLLLAIDNGTQSVKAMVFDLQGNMRAMEKQVFSPYFSRQPGWAEQDPETFWESLCACTRRLREQMGGEMDRVAGLSLTTQRSTVVNLDAEGSPLRPAILWLDQRRATGLPPLSGPWGWLFKIAGLQDTIAYFQAEAEANWLQQHQPGIWERTHKYLLLSGYLTYRLTGRYRDATACCVGYMPFDYKKCRWAGPRDWKWQAIPIRPDMLPSLVPPGDRLGVVSGAAAEQTGLPEGLPMIAAAADKACEVIGSGSLEPSTGCLSYGTTATINVTHRKYVEAIPLLPPYPSAVPGHYTLEVQIFRGYWMVSWFKEEFGHPEVEMAAVQGVEAESLFDRLVADVPPGAMGLMLQPYWSPGLRKPGPEAKGAVIGFGDVHTRAHLYRAILEGLAYALREGKDRIERKTRVPITRLIVSGGGSQSDAAMQATADIFGLPTARPHLYETSGLGAAIDLSVGLGLHDGFASAIRDMTRTRETFRPDPTASRRYDALYRDVYLKMYRKLRPLYRRIRRITGYPA